MYVCMELLYRLCTCHTSVLSSVWSRVAVLRVELLGVAFSEVWPTGVIATIVVATMLLKQVACNIHL